MPPGLDRRTNEPSIPEGIDTRALHRQVRAELRGLPKELAEIVASHLVVAGQLIDEDPEAAHAHAEAAKRRAARLPIVREAVAETAYASGRYDVALQEFRALRRMTGTQDYLPVMADCERALGRPQTALKLAKESHRSELDPALQVEMIIVEAGARSDLGQEAESLRVLTAAVERFGGGVRSGPARGRLFYAYGEALLRAGRDQDARAAFASAATLDTDGETDADERVDELDGIVIDYDDSEDEPQPEAEAPDGLEDDEPEDDEPEDDEPEPDVPEQDEPEPDVPEQDEPEPDVPEQDVPEQDVPEQDVPEQDEPEPDVPAQDVPEQDEPAPDVPVEDAGNAERQE